MATEIRVNIDGTAWQLLEVLQQDGRLSYAELGRRVGMSLSAVAERIKRLEDAGVITGYHARVNPEALGLPLTALVGLKLPASQYKRFLEQAEELPEVRECHHITGDDAFIIKVQVSSMAKLEETIGKLSRFGQTRTSVIMSSPICKTFLKHSGSK